MHVVLKFQPKVLNAKCCSHHLAIVVPVIVGIILGVGGVLGLLIGGLSTGFVLAVFMANAGGGGITLKSTLKKEIMVEKVLIITKLQLLVILLG